MIFSRLSFRFFPPLLWLLVIAFLSLMPADDLLQGGFFGIPHLDKIVHAGMYGILTFLAMWPLKNQGAQVCLYIFIFALFYGGMMEILQSCCAVNRSGNWSDFFADLAGSLAGLAFFRFIYPA